MKLRKDDEVMVMVGKDKGKTGKILATIPATGKVVVDGLNIAKRHTKPSDKNPRGGILEIVKPLDASKVMVIDPATKLPARIGYAFAKDGSKERIFKVSANMKNRNPVSKADKKTDKKADEPKPEVKKTEKKVEKKS